MSQDFHEYPKWVEVNGVPRLVQDRDEEGLLLGVTLSGATPKEPVPPVADPVQSTKRSRK